MLTSERHRTILNILNTRGSVTVTELSGILNTSESTIRRDLNTLDKAGKLSKVFGGAVSIKPTEGVTEQAVPTREILMSDEKNSIARYAAALINDDDFIYIDSGTTTSRMIDFIENTKAIFITNGIIHAQKLLSKGLNAYITGGKIKAVTAAVIGSEGIKSIENYNFTKAFMGTNGIDVQAGFTTPDIEEGLIKEKAIEKSYISFVLADHSKFRKVFPITFAPIKKCCIITDRLLCSEFSDKTIISPVVKCQEENK